MRSRYEINAASENLHIVEIIEDAESGIVTDVVWELLSGADESDYRVASEELAQIVEREWHSMIVDTACLRPHTPAQDGRWQSRIEYL